MFRIGHSMDIHRLKEGRKLILGGIEIDYHLGLDGHSDADCLLHAITEAIIGALALGDIGAHFPDTDPNFKGIDSQILLAKTVEILEKSDYRIGNVDATIYAEAPKMRPYIEAMVKNIAAILKTDITNVNVKATRGEKLGYIGRGEGISSEAVVLLIKKNI